MASAAFVVRTVPSRTLARMQYESDRLPAENGLSMPFRARTSIRNSACRRYAVTAIHSERSAVESLGGPMDGLTAILAVRRRWAARHDHW
jgi:hypothetical protein